VALSLDVGDRVVTRLNQRDIITGTSWVKNGDEWTVTRANKDGSLTARRSSGGPSAVLPVGYVAEHVELAYATTAYRAQGRTVDTAHAYVAIGNSRGSLHVMATRGRDDNKVYVNLATQQWHEEYPETPAAGAVWERGERHGIPSRL